MHLYSTYGFGCRVKLDVLGIVVLVRQIVIHQRPQLWIKLVDWSVDYISIETGARLHAAKVVLCLLHWTGLKTAFATEELMGKSYMFFILIRISRSYLIFL